MPLKDVARDNDGTDSRQLPLLDVTQFSVQPILPHRTLLSSVLELQLYNCTAPRAHPSACNSFTATVPESPIWHIPLAPSRTCPCLTSCRFASPLPAGKRAPDHPDTAVHASPGVDRASGIPRAHSYSQVPAHPVFVCYVRILLCVSED